MKKYECEPCGYIYDEAAGDPDNGVAPGTKWEDLPEDWVCPVCGLGKDVFKEVYKVSDHAISKPTPAEKQLLFSGRRFIIN